MKAYISAQRRNASFKILLVTPASSVRSWLPAFLHPGCIGILPINEQAAQYPWRLACGM